jgi:thioredoxin-related protein
MSGAMTVGLRKWSLTGCILAASAILTTAQEPARTQGAKPGSDAARRALIYDKTADAKVQVAKAVERAKHDDKRILLMFGGDWCSWCHKLHALFKTDREVAQALSNEYVLVTIDLESPNATPLLETCKEALAKEELQKGVGYPFLAVLDADGKVVTAQRTDPLEEGDHHDPKKVADFLNKWKVAPRDAKRVLEDALSRASSDDKRVLLTFGAPWCGWCHELHNWLAQPEIAAIVGRDFIVAQVDIDRMRGGKEVMKTYRPDPSGGIPWYVMLDSRGQSLATADGPDGNIGYPYKPKEIDHFLATVKGQAHRIDAGQLDRLRKSLEENAERIKKRLGR